MDKETVKAKLRTLEPDLKAAGLSHVAVWGSTVRGQANRDSDLDLLYEFDQAKTPSLIGLEHIRNFISDSLGGVPVDLADRRHLKAHIRANADREAELVF
jgi:uncharacterized protein